MLTRTLPVTVRTAIKQELSREDSKSMSRRKDAKTTVSRRKGNRSRSKSRTRSRSQSRNAQARSRSTSKSKSRVDKARYNDAVSKVINSDILRTMLVATFGGAVAHSLAHQKEIKTYISKRISAEPPPPPVLQASRLKQVLYVAGIAWQTMRLLSRLYDIAAPTPWGNTTVLFDALAATLAVPENVRQVLRWRRVLF